MGVTRRLVAIFYTDVVGYSRLSGVDEEGTHRRVMTLLDEVAKRIGAAGGDVLHYKGDAILSVFPSVVPAVDTAASIQTDIAKRNEGLPEDERIQIRIGINVGDVIEDRGEVYGEGVNLAARLEAAAEPGGICISAATHEHCRGKGGLTFRDGGEQAFKNIDGPVRVYRWATGVATEPAPSKDGPPPLPDKPSIAVLPFTNMSRDPEQEYFSDGITEDIITELSRFRSLFVIARNSTFVFKSQAVDIKEVGRRLGVAYVVEGSVRKAGNRVRVTAQLIEASSGNHLWAERYDRDLEDIFTVQDEVARTVAASLPGRIELADSKLAARKPPENMQAYDYVLRGLDEKFYHSAAAGDRAIALFEKAIALDPSFARAHSELANCHIFRTWFDEDFAVVSDHALKAAQRALALDDNDSLAHAIIGQIYTHDGRHGLAARHLDRAVALNPNDAAVLLMQGYLLAVTGKPEEGAGWIEEAMRLNPSHPDNYFDALGDAFYLDCRYQDAAAAFERIGNPPWWVGPALAASHAQAGYGDKARAIVGEWTKQIAGSACPPDGDPVAKAMAGIQDEWRSRLAREEDLENWLQGFRKAGLPV